MPVVDKSGREEPSRDKIARIRRLCAELRELRARDDVPLVGAMRVRVGADAIALDAWNDYGRDPRGLVPIDPERAVRRVFMSDRPGAREEGEAILRMPEGSSCDEAWEAYKEAERRWRDSRGVADLGILIDKRDPEYTNTRTLIEILGAISLAIYPNRDRKHAWRPWSLALDLAFIWAWARPDVCSFTIQTQGISHRTDAPDWDPVFQLRDLDLPFANYPKFLSWVMGEVEPARGFYLYTLTRDVRTCIAESLELMLDAHRAKLPDPARVRVADAEAEHRDRILHELAREGRTYPEIAAFASAKPEWDVQSATGVRKIIQKYTQAHPEADPLPPRKRGPRRRERPAE